jgi:hypothetical protein
MAPILGIDRSPFLGACADFVFVAGHLGFRLCAFACVCVFLLDFKL